MKALFFLIFLSFTNLISLQFSFAQSSQEWLQKYTGPANSIDFANSIATDNTGNVYITGNSFGTLSPSDIVTIKYNSAGQQEWIRIYDSNGNDYDWATDMKVDNAGNVVITGLSNGIDSVYTSKTIKYNSSGEILWVRRYDGDGFFTGSNLTEVDTSGNVYVFGVSVRKNFDFDIFTIKYNSVGDQMWIQKYEGPDSSYDNAYSATLDLLGNVYIAGVSGGEFLTIKYDSNGLQQWIRKYSNDSICSANSVSVDNSGNVFVTGNSYNIYGNKDFTTLKYDLNGVQQWVRNYNGPGNFNDIPVSVAVDFEGNILVCGSSIGNGTYSDYATIKYNTDGTEMWVRRYNGPHNYYDYAESMILDDSGNVYVTGGAIPTDFLGINYWIYFYDYATIKYNSSGDELWVQRYNGPDNEYDFTTSIALDNLGNVIVTGGSKSNTSHFDIVTIKYSQSVGIQISSNEIPNEYSLSQNYPNPFNPATKIKFDIKLSHYSSAQNVILKVFDISGKEITTLIDQTISPGSYEVDFDGSNLSSGVYFYKLETESFSEVKKMVLQK